ncbi:MAG TPA: hypothetical protein VGM46_13385, partial [Mesorhizobium sp.]
FAAMKQPDMRRFPSLEAIPSGEAISADNMATPSIIAMGEPAPGIGYEQVAAIPKPKRGPLYQPMVIRGGVAGDAFAPASSSDQPAVATSAPARSPANPSPAGPASGGQPPSAPPPPTPTAPPVLAPKGMPE